MALDAEDFEVSRGDSWRMVAWSFDFDPSAYGVVLTLKWYGGEIVKTQDDLAGLEIASEGDAWLISWTPTVAESRSIPLGPRTQYELVLTLGDERQTVKAGTVVGVYGLTDA